MSEKHTPSLEHLDRPNAKDSLPHWLSYLENLHSQSIDMGLTRAKEVGDKLSLLKPAPMVIMVGGTNGKGTTCRTLELILLEAGFRVGVYSSPHLIKYNERVRIQGKELIDSEHTTSFAWINAGRGDTSLTYFEFGTLSALHLFKQANLDVVILEVGLGGRLDSCNIVDADVAVITSIDIDHVDWLGDNRDVIAKEKAGIFRAHRPAVVGEPNIPQTLIEFANQIEAPLYEIGQVWHFKQETDSWHWHGTDLQLLSLPYPQIPVQNAATALAALYAGGFLNRADDKRISEKQIKDALTKVSLSGRFQIIETQELSIAGENKTVARVILDVAHNPHAAKYLSSQVNKLKMNLPPQVQIHFIIGMLADKDISSTLNELLPAADSFHFISLDVPRGASASLLCDKLNELQSLNISSESQPLSDKPKPAMIHSSIQDAYHYLGKEIGENDIIIICGSFYTVAEFLTSSF